MTNAPSITPAKGSNGLAVRLACRAAEHRRQTSGLAPGYVQANLAIMPSQYADDFLRFCQRNPKPCPVLAVSEPGAVAIPNLATDLDIRTDLPGYRVFRDGQCTGDVDDLRDLWQEDFVTFALGCSFSFEEALIDNGLGVRHIEMDVNVPMYRSNIATVPAGPFAGPMVVSMRPFKPADAIRAIQITSRFPGVHGAPVHIGMPEDIGISDLAQPWQGDAVPIAADELPVFWACGITPQAIILEAALPLFITHTPGFMLVTDLKNSSLSVI
ncbi:MAG: putative hydro-lyase [Alphaproteobacteria bacterium]